MPRLTVTLSRDLCIPKQLYEILLTKTKPDVFSRKIFQSPAIAREQPFHCREAFQGNA